MTSARRCMVGLATVIVGSTLALPLVTAAPASAESTCTPSVSLRPLWTDADNFTHYVADYDSCGRFLLMRFKTRSYKDGPYEWFYGQSVQGRGTLETQTGGCGGFPDPQKIQALVILKDGSERVAKSNVRTYTRPGFPDC